MSFINFLGAAINSKLGLQGGLYDFTETLGIVGIFCLLYLGTALLNFKKDPTIVMPVIRTFFWSTLILFDIIKSSGGEYNFEYLLIICNGALFTFHNAIIYFLLEVNIVSHYFVIFIVAILLIAIYELVLIKVSSKLVDKYLFKV